MVKTFGESVEKVLFVFDGQKAPDMNALVSQVGWGSVGWWGQWAGEVVDSEGACGVVGRWC